MSTLPKVDWSQAICRILAVLIMLVSCSSGYAMTPDEQEEYRRKKLRLSYYREAYSKEIYGYCARNFRNKESRLVRCLDWHDRLKGEILANAQRYFGSESLAQGIYDQCYDYHPYEGVARIGECVSTRLKINKLVADEAIEKQIYHGCYRKRSKHGASAINNCANSDARYYRRTGILRDR